MAFHEGFILEPRDRLHTPNWFAMRAELYKEVSAWLDKPFDVVYFDFSAPYCGWIDVTIYVNGKKKHQFPLTAAFDSISRIKNWLEDIVNDTKLSTDLFLEFEGRGAVLHYEHIRLAEVGYRRKYVSEDRDKDEWESFDANNKPDTGLFYLYDSSCKGIPVVCYCKTKQFIFALYNGLMHYSSKGEYARLIGSEWFYMDHDKDGTPTKDRWTFYNLIKSPLIEWNYDSKKAFRHVKPEFKETPFIVETVHMWAEWAGGLFWHQRGGCCGKAEGFFVDTGKTRVDLRDMPEIRTWYNEFDNRIPEEEWPEKEFEPWFNRGWEFAKKIRQRLPMNVDLYYHWKTFYIEGPKHMDYVDIPIIVPDERLLIQRKRNPSGETLSQD